MKHTKLLGLVLPLVFGVACGDDDDPDPTDNTMTPMGDSIVALAQATPDLSTLVTLLTDADLVDTLSGPGPFTVFAPTNAAFNAVPSDLLAFLQGDVSRLQDVLTYHVVPTEAFAADLTDGQTLTTVEGTTLTVNVSGGAVSVTDALGNTFNVVTADIDASNGVVHIIDGVLLPRSFDIVDIASEASLGELVAALDAAGLSETLEGAGPFTVFAPTDAAFQAIDPPSNTSLLANILLNHVVIGDALDASELTAAGEAAVASGLTLPFDGTGPTIDGVTISSADVEASNGIVHVIDAVLVPPTILDFAVDVSNDSGEFSSLVEAVTAASPSISELLGGDGPITVFAPTNAAFAAAFPGVDLSTLDPADLDAVLSIHVVQSQFLAEDFTDGQNLTTVGGGVLTVNVSDSGAVSVTDEMGATFNVSTANTRLLNGVVHVIDGVLMPMPPEPGLVDVLEDNGFATLVSALETTGLDLVLQAADATLPLTVFAPTDAAFAGVDLPDDNQLLTNILLNHVASGNLGSTDVLGLDSVPMLSGLALFVDATATPPTIGGAGLVNLDLQPENPDDGTVHGIDDVLLPPTIVEAVSTFPDFASLLDAVNNAPPEILAALDVEGPITVFAPTNEALDSAGLGDVTERRLGQVLSYHVVDGQFTTLDLSDGDMLTTLEGSTLTVSCANPDCLSGAVTLTDETGAEIPVLLPDIRLANGAVHIIDGVLDPGPGNIVDVASDAGTFGSLLGLATRVGLDATLTSPGPFTVFAPTDDAFTALGLDTEVIADGVISNILLHHVLAGSVDAAQVLASTSLDTEANTSLPITMAGEDILVDEAILEATDVPASNGIVHILGGVMIPPTIVEQAAATPALSSLTTAVTRAGLAEALTPATTGGAAPLTVFAPTDDAFMMEGVDAETAPVDVLTPVLLYHVVDNAAEGQEDGQFVAEELQDGQTLTMLDGNTLTVNVEGDSVTLTDGAGDTINVVIPNVRTLNGVVHVIDRVLTAAP
ncbi:MAG: fasciclin domain-containing protein [Myxococcota bacterium]